MKYDYGDEVTVQLADGSNITRTGAIVGITEVASEKQAETLKHPVGTVLYTVEFGDGSDALIPESDLLPLDS